MKFFKFTSSVHFRLFLFTAIFMPLLYRKYLSKNHDRVLGHVLLDSKYLNASCNPHNFQNSVGNVAKCYQLLCVLLSTELWGISWPTKFERSGRVGYQCCFVFRIFRVQISIFAAGKCQDCTSNYAFSASFHILSNVSYWHGR